MDNKLVWTAFSVDKLFSILSNISSGSLPIRSTFSICIWLPSFSNDGDFFMDGIVDEVKGFCGRDMRRRDVLNLTTIREKKRCEVLNRWGKDYENEEVRKIETTSVSGPWCFYTKISNPSLILWIQFYF